MSLGGQTAEGGEHLAGGAQGILEGMGATDDSRGSGRRDQLGPGGRPC